MASGRKSGPLDPLEHGPWLFDHHPKRLSMAVACRSQALESRQLAAVSKQSDANARKSAKTLLKWGILEQVELAADKPGFRLVEKWRDPVDEAELRAKKGRLESGQTLLLILRDGVGAFYHLVADQDRPDPRLAWVTRLPHHSRFGLIVLVNPALDEEQVERLTIELDRAGIGHERLVLGRMAGYTELREFAAGSLPGAFGPGQ